MTTNPNFKPTEYVSDYESDTRSEADLSSLECLEKNKSFDRDEDFSSKPGKRKLSGGISKTAYDEEQRQAYNSSGKHQLLSLNAYERHKKMVNNYLMLYGGKMEDFKQHEKKYVRDTDIIKQNQRFLWTDDDQPTSWSDKLAKRYWEKLFKEYCLIDLSRYKDNKVGMRWRLEKEVVSGKGQFVCGNVVCQENQGLRSWEVNFGYVEKEKRKNALVKVRLCKPCSDKLNFHHKRKEVIPVSKHLTTSSGDADLSLAKRQRTIEDKSENSVLENKEGDTSKPDQAESVWRGSNVEQNVTASGDDVAGGVRTQEDDFDDYLADMLL